MRILVTGASGYVGHKIIEVLLEMNTAEIIAGTRTPETLQAWADKGLEVRRVDFDDPSLSEAFQGIDRLLIVSTDDLDTPGRRARQHQAAITAAKKTGVRHIVYTSFAAIGEHSHVVLAADHRTTEAALAASGIPFTALRNNVYTDLFLRSLPRAIASGQLQAAGGNRGAAYVTRDDCARTAAAIVSAPTPPVGPVDVSGPAMLTYDAVTEIASDITGTRIAYQSLTVEALIRSMVVNGLPKLVAGTIASLDAGIAHGEFEAMSDAVVKWTGTPPTSVREFLLAHKQELE